MINDTLKERGSRYGEFKTAGDLANALKETMRSHPDFEYLQGYQAEALDMIQHKVSRIINGDPSYGDSWHDIAGYATLVENELNKGENNANN